jgi:uncharacterized protein
MLTVFHPAIHVHDLDAAPSFYRKILGRFVQRPADAPKAAPPTPGSISTFSATSSALHLGAPFPNAATARVGNVMVPMPHFGLVLPLSDWQPLADRLTAADTDLVLKPSVRFAGKPCAQWTMFFRGPSGNPIAVKAFPTMNGVFAH